MHVNKTIETPEGTIVFEGELAQDEADLVVKIGLSTLFKLGALPFVKNEPGDEIEVPENMTKQ